MDTEPRDGMDEHGQVPPDPEGDAGQGTELTPTAHEPTGFLAEDFKGGVGPTAGRNWAGILPPDAEAKNLGPGRAIAALLFRPSAFFARYGSIEAMSGALFVVMWIVSMMLLADKFETNVLSGKWTAIPPNWWIYWAGLLVFSLIGILGIMLRGWWFRLRLYFCGVGKAPAYWRGLRIWSCASLISAVPLLSLVIANTVYFDTPDDMIWLDLPGELVWIWAFLTLPYWSIVASYRGVRTVFPDSGKWRVRLWFLMLPMVALTIGLGAIMVMSYINGFPTPPDTDRPQAFESRAFGLDYPGNWTLADTWEEHDPDRLLFFETPQGGTVSLMLMPTPWSAEAHIADRREMLLDFGIEMSDGTPFSRMVSRTGTGERSTYTDLLVPWVHELFVTDLSEFAALEVEVMRPKTAASDTDEGIRFILDSLDVRTPDASPVDLDDPVYSSHDRWAMNYPRDWFLIAHTPEQFAIEAWRPAEWSAQIYRSSRSVDEELQATIDGVFAGAEGLEREAFSAWAGLEGSGVVVRGVQPPPAWLDTLDDADLAAGDDDEDIPDSPETEVLGSEPAAGDPAQDPSESDLSETDPTLAAWHDDAPIELRVFIHELPDGELLEIRSFVRIEDLDEIGPAFGLIESSFSLKARSSPDSDG